MTEAGSEGPEGHLRDISGPVWRVSNEVNSGSILRSILVNSRPYLRNLIRNTDLAFIWPWVGLKARYILNMGPGAGLGGVPV